VDTDVVLEGCGTLVFVSDAGVKVNAEAVELPKPLKPPNRDGGSGD
jgi:hypothetical protein